MMGEWMNDGTHRLQFTLLHLVTWCAEETGEDVALVVLATACRVHILHIPGFYVLMYALICSETHQTTGTHKTWRG